MGSAGRIDGSGTRRRVCARPGCSRSVNKTTAKYCSVACCALDPVRRERIREQSRRAQARPLAMVHQLTLSLNVSTFDPEAELARVCVGREDVPGGMSRLAG